jgi:hypothetical protein
LLEGLGNTAWIRTYRAEAIPPATRFVGTEGAGIFLRTATDPALKRSPYRGIATGGFSDNGTDGVFGGCNDRQRRFLPAFGALLIEWREIGKQRHICSFRGPGIAFLFKTYPEFGMKVNRQNALITQNPRFST